MIPSLRDGITTIHIHSNPDAWCDVSCKEGEEAVPSSPETTEESEMPHQVCADEVQAEDPTQEAATELVSDSAPDHYDMSTLQVSARLL